MKIILSLLAILFATNLCAQNAPSENCELPRRAIKPYATVEEALLSSDVSSHYITPLAEWSRDESDDEVVFTTTYTYPAAWLNRQLLLRVESASSGYSVAINGSQVGSTANGTNPVEFNLTRKSQQGLNELQITLPKEDVAAALLQSGAPALGKVMIVSQPTIRVRDVDNATRLNDSGDGIVEFNIVVKTDALNPKSSRIHYELLSPDTTRLAYGYKDVTIEMRGEDTVSFATIIPHKWLWSVHNPTLLRLVVRNQIEGRYAENIALPIGVREVEYVDKKLTVNGKLAALRVVETPADISAEQIAAHKVQGYNALVVKAGVAADALYARCDSVGVYVIPQLAVDTSHGDKSIKRGGNPSNNPVWKPHYLARAEQMYHTSKSHPSVVAFSLGGGATNGINLYESYLLLKQLDNERPVMFLGADGEWNNDIIEGSILPQDVK